MNELYVDVCVCVESSSIQSSLIKMLLFDSVKRNKHNLKEMQI